MKVHEYQAKEIVRRYGLPVPDGRVASTPDEAEAAAAELGGRVAVKAQVHAGGRGKAGGIRVAGSPLDARRAAEEILGMRIKGLEVKKVYVESAVDIEKEYYAGVTLDRGLRRPVVLVSSEGGIDIEEVAAKTPEKIGRAPVDPLVGLQPFVLRRAAFEGGVPADEVNSFVKVLRGLVSCFFDLDATLAEINPLCRVAGGEHVAADCKIDFDDSALFRHQDIKSLEEESEDDEIEREAHRRGLAYVRLDGAVGVIGNGAGLVMATLDMVSAAGAKPANFLDIGGGARADVVRNAVEIILMDPEVRGILINVFGGITRCDEVANGIIEATSSMDIKVPLVIRLKGTREEEGRKILNAAGFSFAPSVREAAEKIVSLIQ
ncbi:MAG: ADP-forming succinate--CoA ligase subunit beta [bacterium]